MNFSVPICLFGLLIFNQIDLMSLLIVGSQELVPCVLLSFDQEQILMWRGKEWKSMYRNAFPASSTSKRGVKASSEMSGIYMMEIIKFGHWLVCTKTCLHC